MQLRGARLCLDCEEIHSDDQCPVCASDAFAFLTRWIPPNERRVTPRATRPRPLPPPPGRTSQLVKGGAIGVAAIAAARWLWHVTRPSGES